MAIIVLLLIIIILVELYLLSLQCRRGHPGLAALKVFKYTHRGFYDEPSIPENSLKAFQRSIRNFYGTELDIHLTKDGHLAVIHDSSLKRTAGVDVRIEDLTIEELKTYRLSGTDEKIPLFDEVLQLFEGRTPLIIELKPSGNNYRELTEAAVSLVKKYEVTYCMESFDPRCIYYLRKHYPEIIRGQLSENFSRQNDGGKQNPLILFVLARLMTNFLTRPDFIAYRFSDRNNLSLKLCRKCYHVQEVNWTIQSKEEMHEAEKAGNIVIFEHFDPHARH